MAKKAPKVMMTWQNKMLILITIIWRMAFLPAKMRII